MSNSDTPYYRIDDLANESGMDIRTIRYYVQKGLIPKAEGAGRGRFYTQDHLIRLKEIKHWRLQGLRLEAIRRVVESRHPGVSEVVAIGGCLSTGPERWIQVNLGSTSKNVLFRLNVPGRKIFSPRGRSKAR